MPPRQEYQRGRHHFLAKHSTPQHFGIHHLDSPCINQVESVGFLVRVLHPTLPHLLTLRQSDLPTMQTRQGSNSKLVYLLFKHLKHPETENGTKMMKATFLLLLQCHEGPWSSSSLCSSSSSKSKSSCLRRPGHQNIWSLCICSFQSMDIVCHDLIDSFLYTYFKFLYSLGNL